MIFTKKSEQNKSQENTTEFIILNIPTRTPGFILTEKRLTLRRVVFRSMMCGKEEDFFFFTSKPLSPRLAGICSKKRIGRNKLTFLYSVNMYQVPIIQQPLHQALRVEQTTTLLIYSIKHHSRHFTICSQMIHIMEFGQQSISSMTCILRPMY